jgi:hypothetical protein
MTSRRSDTRDHPEQPVRRLCLVAFWAAALAAFLVASARADQAAEAAAAREKALTMERYIVSATRTDKSAWRYGSAPGFEVLSRAGDRETNEMLVSLEHGLWLQNDVLPKDWLPSNPIPYTVIIDNTDLSTVPIGQVHAAPILLQAPVDAAAWGRLSASALVWNDHFESHDGDTLAFNSNIFGVNMRDLSYGSVSLDRLGHSTPPLPIWVMAGLLGKDSGLFREGYLLVQSEGIFGHGWIRQAKGPGTVWISLDETKRLVERIRADAEKNTTTPIEIMPLREFFNEAPIRNEDIPVWSSQAALLLRWGLMGPGSEDPVLSHAFLELVRRARSEPVTEKVFTDCFGFGYEAMGLKLQEFLRSVLLQPTSVDLDIPDRFPKLVLKTATSDQIGRIVGDWLRMLGDSVRAKDPDMCTEFLFSAGRMLGRAYRYDVGLQPEVDRSSGGEGGPSAAEAAAGGRAFAMKPFSLEADLIHDPRLLAVYGLYEHDAGDDMKAREFLEAAVAAGVVRPRAYIALAKLRYLDAVARPMGSDGKLNAVQAASILEPLRASPKFAPDLEVLELTVATWSRCDAMPSRKDIEDIAGGVALFPRETDLALSSALLCAQSGYPGQAATLIDEGLVFSAHEGKRRYFEQLRSTLDLPAAPEAK